MATWWSELSERSRRLIIAAAVGEAVLKAAVVIDIRRRPASRIRGSKPMWIVAAVLVNSAGVGPLSYLVFGRRPASQSLRQPAANWMASAAHAGVGCRNALDRT